MLIDDGHSLQCDCGNIPEEYGFYPCDIDGNETAGVLDNLWCCDKCGAIIDDSILEIIGYRKEGYKRYELR